MKLHFRLRHLTVCAAAVLFASGAAAAGAPIFQNPGQWLYTYVARYAGGPMSRGTIRRSWSECVTPEQSRKPPTGLPHVPGVHCAPPTLTRKGPTLHTRLVCTAVAANGMHSTIATAFSITRAPDRDSIRMSGTVRQKVTGLPVKVPAIIMHVHLSGKRTGGCTAAAKRP